MEYGASHGSLPQSPMQYPMSVNNAHSQDIPHGLPDMTRGPSHMGHLGSRNSLNRSF
ncbi:hypothetical protein BJY04DRAFT_182937 [Aspergillus karnatakaensis]|uniref:uncharacterized protein n=1 Tax=Aspergillus karnatakaensis TaxID=1810916 RepID=UPI003CCE1A90